MNDLRRFSATILCILVMAAVPALAQHDHDHGSEKDSHDDHGHAEEGHHEEEAERGPHGGRLAREGERSLELAIFATGVAPQFRLWIYDGDKPVDPAGVTATLTLTRLGRAPEKFSFRPVGDFLVGDRSVVEPHAFTIDLDASWEGGEVCGAIEMVEAQVRMSADVAAAGAVTSEVASSRDLGRELRLTGRIGIPSDRLAALRPRFAGVVREATATIGAAVRRGDTLATVESDATLASYPVRSPLDGVIVDREATIGSAVEESDTLFTVADLSEVWADLDLYGPDANVVRVGESLRVRDETRQVEATTTVSYVSPLRDVHTQTTLARAVLDNRDGRWAPGTFITATLAIAEPPAAVAVPKTALQTWRGAEAVFVKYGEVYEARRVTVGRKGPALVEITEGLEAGQAVATGNTFLLRAEIEKAGAAHEH